MYNVNFHNLSSDTLDIIKKSENDVLLYLSKRVSFTGNNGDIEYGTIEHLVGTDIGSSAVLVSRDAMVTVKCFKKKFGIFTRYRAIKVIDLLHYRTGESLIINEDVVGNLAGLYRTHTGNGLASMSLLVPYNLSLGMFIQRQFVFSKGMNDSIGVSYTTDTIVSYETINYVLENYASNRFASATLEKISEEYKDVLLEHLLGDVAKDIT